VNVRIILLLCACIGPFPVVGFEEAAAVSVQIEASGYSSIMRGLPWEFRQIFSSKGQAEDGANAETRHDFVSAEPVRSARRGAFCLKADFTISEFRDQAMAERRWQTLRQKAQPDLGLSCAWDYLVFRDRAICQLHAACTFSDQSFDTMAANLRAMLPEQEKDTGHQIRCNCGGGCRRGAGMAPREDHRLPR
jgi:hypothetical protein